MKGFVGGVINLFFFPFRLVGRIFNYISKPIKFFNEQRAKDRVLRANINKFYKRKKKQSYLNDELV